MFRFFFLVLVAFSLAGCAMYQFKKDKGQYYTWEQGDSFSGVAAKFGTTDFEILQANSIIDPQDITPGYMIFIPVEPPEKEKPKHNAVHFPDDKPGFKIYGRNFTWPSPGTVTSCFGRRWGRPHEGIDMGKDQGLKVVAAANGVVEFSGRQSGYGNTVIINHGSGIKTLYGHADSIKVKEGQEVKQGQWITVMGKSGRSTGVHLHFEVRIKGVARNPVPYLPRRQNKCG